MEEFNVVNRIDELERKAEQINALFDVVFSYVLDFDKADPNSEDETERLHATELCGLYPTFSNVLRTAWDISFDLQNQLQTLSDEIAPGGRFENMEGGAA